MMMVPLRRTIKRYRPAWTYKHHPVVKYILQQNKFRSSPRVLVLAGGVLFLQIFAIEILTYLLFILTGFEGLVLSEERTAYIILYPLVAILQFLSTFGLIILAMSVRLTPPRSSFEQVQQAWELIRVTSHGTALVTRAQWYVMLVGTSTAPLLILTARMLFAIWIAVDWLRDPEMFHSALNQTQPDVSDPVACFLLALWLTTMVILPVTTIAMSITVGTLLSAKPRRPWKIHIIQGTIFFLAIILVFTGIFVDTEIIKLPDEFALSGWIKLGSLGGLAVSSDQGLRLLSRPVLLRVIELVDYALWFGLPLAALIVIQVVSIPWLLRWAAHIAARPTNE